MISAIFNFTTDEENKSVLELFDRLEGTYFKNKNDRKVYVAQDVDDPEFIRISNLFADRFIKSVNWDLYLHSCVMAKYNAGQKMIVHSDIMNDTCLDDLYTMIVYFTDQYEGGELYFPYHDPYFEIKPDKSMALVYPTEKNTINGKYMHGVKEITSGTRYAMAFCFTTNEKFANIVYK